MRCELCGGGRAHHSVPGGGCWCPGCLKKPEDRRCREWKPIDQPDVVGRPAAYVGKGHPGTAQQMQAKALPRSGSFRREVYDFILRAGVEGLTDDEIEYKTGRSHQSVSGARNTLMNDGLIKDTGLRRPNRYGNQAIAWRTTRLNS